MRAVAVSPAKVILFGEHFVVNGNSAISMAINLPTIATAESAKTSGVTIVSKNLKLEAHFSFEGVLEEEQAMMLNRFSDQYMHAISSLSTRPHEGIKLSIESRVPIGMGLGSSAATAVATLSSVTALWKKTLQKDDIFHAAYSLEKMIHGRPSGVDQATVTYGGLIVYRNGKVESEFTDLQNPP